MGKIKLLICLLSVSFIYFTVSAQEKNDAWDYSDFKAKSKTWDSLTSYKEKINDCQIPNILLKSISTEGLVETCLTFPFYMDIFAFNDLQLGFKSISSRFNGFEELFKRDDAGIVLLRRYEEMKPDAFNDTWTNLQKGNLGWEFSYIEILLAQDEIINKLNKNERLKLLTNCLQKLRLKQNNPELYGMNALEINVLVMGRVLMLEEFPTLKTKLVKNNNLKTFIEKVKLMETSSLDDIIICAEQYISINK